MPLSNSIITLAISTTYTITPKQPIVDCNLWLTFGSYQFGKEKLLYCCSLAPRYSTVGMHIEGKSGIIYDTEIFVKSNVVGNFELLHGTKNPDTSVVKQFD